MYIKREIRNGINCDKNKDFKELFNNIYPSLCVFIKKYIAQTDIVEDIAQETFLLFWEKNRQFKDINSIKGFLYLTAKNKCWNYLKLKKIRDNTLKRWQSEELFYEFIIEEETYQEFYKIIKNLPPQTKRIIELSMQGYKNPEISKELNVSINTIKTLKKNGYSHLREELKHLIE